MLSIRNATIADISLIQQLTMEVWPQTYIPIIGEQQVAYMLDKFYSAESLASQIETQGHTFLICYDGQTPVAFASYGRVADDTFKLHKLYILPGQQGKGIGAYLISHITAAIKGERASKLILNVNIHNHPAISFYRKMGFTQYKAEDIDIGSGYYMNDYVLKLDLNG